MTERMESGRSDQQSPRWRVLLTARRVQFLLVSAIALLMLGGAIGGYMIRPEFDLPRPCSRQGAARAAPARKPEAQEGNY